MNKIIGVTQFYQITTFLAQLIKCINNDADKHKYYYEWIGHLCNCITTLQINVTQQTLLNNKGV